MIATAPISSTIAMVSSHGQIDQRRRGHTGYGGNDRQPPPRRAGQLAVQNLALDFKADSEEEQRHQAIVDPGVQIAQRRDRRPGQSAMQRRVPAVCRRRIGKCHCQRSHGNQQQATPGFAVRQAAQ
jgi:hypothetical protein